MNCIVKPWQRNPFAIDETINEDLTVLIQHFRFPDPELNPHEWGKQSK